MSTPPRRTVGGSITARPTIHARWITVCASGNVANIYGCAAANRQPITVRPVVGRGPYSTGQTIYFGTGKFFEDGDNAITAGATGPVQSFYAVQDDNANNS
jgi:type IV pilus assembly protein PilY1